MVAAALTDAEIADAKAKRVSMFKGTIAVCAIYGAIAVGIIVVAALTEFGKQFVIEQMAVFTIALLVGMSLIIVFLGVSVYKWEPTVMRAALTDKYTCPDFYELTETPKTVLDKVPADKKDMFAWQCTPIESVWKNNGAWSSAIPSSTPTILSTSTAGTNSNLYKAFVTDTALGTTDADRITCSKFYPIYMDYVDNADNPSNPTKYRCGMINDSTSGNSVGCNGITWSAVCPKISTTYTET